MVVLCFIFYTLFLHQQDSLHSSDDERILVMVLDFPSSPSVHVGIEVVVIVVVIIVVTVEAGDDIDDSGGEHEVEGQEGADGEAVVGAKIPPEIGRL